MTSQYVETGISAASAAVSAIAGTLTSHPFDRASFLAAKHKRSFFKFENFYNPYQGFVQASTHKAFMGSPMYFFLMDQMTSLLKPYLSTNQGNQIQQTTAIAFGVGATHGFLSTPALAVKSYTWSTMNPQKYWIQNARAIYQFGGIKPFIRCTPAIVARDAINATVYEYVRLSLKEQEKKVFIFQYSFLCNVLGSTCAIFTSSIFNYVRQHQLAAPPQAPSPSSRTLITQLWQESKIYSGNYDRSAFIFKRLQLPVSLLRFSLLIPIFQEAYEYCKQMINQQIESNQTRHTPR